MADPNRRLNKSEEGFLDQADNLLKKKVLLNILTEEDAVCIRSFVSEIAATQQISSARRYKLTLTLANSRKWLKTPFRKMATPDLFMCIDAIMNDPGLNQESIGDYIRYLKEIAIWLIENELAGPGLKIEKVRKIAPPVYAQDEDDSFDADSSPDALSHKNSVTGASSGAQEEQYEMSNLVTLAKIFQKNKKYDLAAAIAQYCVNDSNHQKTCFDILMRCAYSQKDFQKSLEYVEKLLDMDPRNSRYFAYKNQILEKIS